MSVTLPAGQHPLPGLTLPGEFEPREHVEGEVRLWAGVVRSASVVTLLPDLSRDLLLSESGAPVVTARTHAVTRVGLEGRRMFAGARLPIAAHEVRIDRTWPGWSGRAAPEERLRAAIGEGVVSWTADPVVGAALPGLASSLPVADVASRLFLAERTLRRRFVATLGVGPAYVRRVLRLHRLAQLVRHSGLATAVAHCGFADQSHAIRDVRLLTGLRLTEFARVSVSE